jgi:hypothetical protein
MNTALKPLPALLLALMAGVVAAQEPPTTAPATTTPAGTAPAAPAGKPAKSSAQIDAGEPRADTSSTPESGAPASPAPAGPAGGATAAGASSGANTPAAPAPRGSSRTAASGTAGANPAQPHAAAPGPKAPGGVDRLSLGTATVTGDREQPKVMYIVPWKKPDIGDVSGKPMNSLLDEALAPVDRDEFKREVVYFDAVRADTPQNGPAAAAAKQGEK